MKRGGATYIMTNKYNTVLYTGVTADLVRRIYEHRTHADKKSFTHKYNCTKLVWYRLFNNIEEAIVEEKRIKGGSRKKKVDLVNSINSEWYDLWDTIKKW
jgi:putative endonuclease